MSTKRIFTASLFTSLLYILSLPVEARLYKWIDEQGQVKYGDRIPPQYINKKHHQLDKEGRVIITNEAKKSPAEVKKERAEQERLKKEKLEQEQRAKELKEQQEKKDRILLLTFNSEDEIFLARDQRVSVIDSKIKLLNKSLTSAKSKLADLNAQADRDFRSKNQEVPGGLQQKIEQFSKTIASTNENIQQSKRQRAEVETNFQQNLLRFRNLKSRQRSP